MLLFCYAPPVTSTPGYISGMAFDKHFKTLFIASCMYVYRDVYLCKKAEALKCNNQIKRQLLIICY